MSPSLRRGASAALFLVVLLAAFAPWVSVACGGETLQITGREMALGRLDDNPELGISSSPADEREPEWLVVAAFAAALVGLTGVAGAGRTGALVRAGVGVVGATLVIVERVDLHRRLTEELGDQPEVLINWELGWWLALGAFLLVTPLQFVRGGSEETGGRSRPASLGVPVDVDRYQDKPRPYSGLPQTTPHAGLQRHAGPEVGEGVVMIGADRGLVAILGGIGLLALSVGLQWADFTPGISREFGPLLLAIAAATAASVGVLDLTRLAVPLRRANRLLGAAGVVVVAIVLVETVRLIVEERELRWGLAPALVGSAVWAVVGVARGWPEALASLQASPMSQSPGAALAPCPNCSAVVAADAMYCPRCGHAMGQRAPVGAVIREDQWPPAERVEEPDISGSASAEPRCHSCGASVDGLKFCTACGAAVAAPA